MADIAVFVKPVPVTVNGVPGHPLDVPKLVIDILGHSTLILKPAAFPIALEVNFIVIAPLLEIVDEY